MQVSPPLISMFAAANARRPSRRGVSILEVLFAIAVTTIGLLGAIAVFPVASSQARKGRISDSLAVAGMSAAHDFDVREMRKPCTWVAWNSNTNAWFSPWQNWQQFKVGDTTNGKNWFSGEFAFCIDPRFIAINNDTNTNRTSASRFPIDRSATPDGPGVGMGRISITGGFPQSPIPRPYDLASPPPLPAVNGPIGTAVAEALFMFDDDLTYERPGDRTLAAVQMMDTSAKRQSDGHMTWMATLVPKLDQMASDAELYVLSIVVFYDRPLASFSDGFGNLGTGSFGEQEVWVDSLPGSGITGGEVVLGANSAEALKAKANDWVLLSGQTKDTKRPMFRWYRVVDADDEALANTSGVGRNYQRHVTLFGPDWNASVLDSTSPDLQRAVLVEGVVGVYEKTIRLDLTPSN